MMRVGSIKKLYLGPQGRRVGKILRKVIRRDPNTDENVEICLFKLHYNGSVYITPVECLDPVDSDDRKKDKRNMTYWRNEYQYTTSNIYWTNSPRHYIAM